MNYQIDQLKKEFERQENELNQAIIWLTEMVEEEKKYTQSLMPKPPKAKETIAAPPISKAEKVAKMSGEELMKMMATPKGQAELFKDLI
jgi:hypothetical protein